ncbi:MAG: ligand-gated channel, partial [Gammaproteobacteria bacterium]|nr:ligand-gated channel [Gammaproteobacteria bacterium]
MPLSISYTWLDSRFDSDIADTDFFGDVSRGDPIPYLPEQQLQLATGLVGPRWSHFINLNFQMGVCVRASCGPFEKTENNTTLDLTSQLELNGATQIFFKIENALNAQRIVGRQPYGARTNRNKAATLGFRLSL